MRLRHRGSDGGGRLLRVRVIGVPSAWGAPQTAVAVTPRRLRQAGLLDWLTAPGVEVQDGGDVPVPAGRHDSSAAGRASDGSLAHLDEVVAVVRAVRAAVSAALGDDRFPLLVGGECSLAIGAVPAIAASRGAVGVVWLDAHGDLNTPETSKSGLITGMPLAVIHGAGDPALLEVGDDVGRPDAARTWLLGARDLDAGEVGHLSAWDMNHLDVQQIRGPGAEETVARALGVDPVEVLPPEARASATTAVSHRADARAHGSDPDRDPTGPVAEATYLHVDIDCLDPQEAPGVSFRVPEGLRLDEVADLTGYACASGRVAALALASANLDSDGGDRTLTAIRDLCVSVADGLRFADPPGPAPD